MGRNESQKPTNKEGRVKDIINVGYEKEEGKIFRIGAFIQLYHTKYCPNDKREREREKESLSGRKRESIDSGSKIRYWFETKLMSQICIMLY